MNYTTKKSTVEQELVFALAQFPCPVTVPEIVKVANERGNLKLSRPEAEALLGKLCLDGDVVQFEVERYQCNHIWHSDDDKGERIRCSRCGRVESTEEKLMPLVEVIDRELELKCHHQKELACEHGWSFELIDDKFIDRCTKCQQTRNIETSDRLEELIFWLNQSKEEFELHAKNTKDDRRRNYYLEYVREKQQQIDRTLEQKAILLEKEKEELLKIEAELKEIQEDFITRSSDRYTRIIDTKLYKSLGYNNFKVYCSERLGISYRQVHRLIDAAKVINNLKSVTSLSQNKKVTNWSPLPLPTSELQCRVLAKLEPEKQVEVWKKGLEERDGKIPSAKALEKIVEAQKKPVGTTTKYDLGAEVPSCPIKIKYKKGHPIEYSLNFVDEKSYQLLAEYCEISGVASADGIIQRVFPEIIERLKNEVGRS